MKVCSRTAKIAFFATRAELTLFANVFNWSEVIENFSSITSLFLAKA